MYHAGDELLSDSFPYKEIENGMLWEVEGKVSWVVVIIYLWIIEISIVVKHSLSLLVYILFI